jgi:hypothetical protein
MYKITYQLRTYLQMQQMGWEEWQECLAIAKDIVLKIRKVYTCICKGKTADLEADVEFQAWLTKTADELDRDGKNKKALELRDPKNTADALKKYVAYLKTTLPGVCFQASDFAVSIGEKAYNKNKSGHWREQRYAFLSGLVVIDVDHLPHARELFERLKNQFDFVKEGILLIYISARGEGLKIIFKARPEWSNLICQQYEMASKLGILDYVDDSCKDSSRLSFLTGEDDVLYVDSKELFNQ